MRLLAFTLSHRTLPEMRHIVCINTIPLITLGGKLAMSQTSRIVKSNPDELPADVVELSAAIARLPEGYRQMLNPALNRVVDSTKRRRRILNLIQDALG